jgi:hypothetical protein
MGAAVKRRPAANVLDAYRAAAAPEAAVRERVLGELSRRMANGEHASQRAAAPRPWLREVPSVAASTWLLKLRATALALGACIAAALWFWPAGEARLVSAPVNAPSAVRPRSDAAAAAAARVPAAAVEVERVPAAVEVESPPAAKAPAAPHAAHRRAARVRLAQPSAPRLPPSAAAAPPPSSEVASGRAAAAHGDLEEELRLMRAAYDALRDGRLGDATAKLDEHAARFAHGELAESREVAQIMVLCKAGQTATARARVAQFLHGAANSPYAARVRSLCSGP